MSEESRRLAVGSVQQIQQVLEKISDRFEGYSWEKRWQILLIFARFTGSDGVLLMAYSAVAHTILTGKRTQVEITEFLRELNRHVTDDDQPPGPFLGAA